MSWSKVACLKCSHYHTCSPTTRMFVNYCGSDRKNVEKRIHCATSDCRSQRGYLLKHDIIAAQFPYSAVLFNETSALSAAAL